MLSSELNKMLVSRFPNLQEKYLEEVSWQENHDTGSHIVYGDVLAPYLSDCLLKDNIKEIQLVFDFLEEILKLEDKYADEVVYFSVFESVAYFFKEKDFLIPYLGEKCKIALNAVK